MYNTRNLASGKTAYIYRRDKRFFSLFFSLSPYAKFRGEQPRTGTFDAQRNAAAATLQLRSHVPPAFVRGPVRREPRILFPLSLDSGLLRGGEALKKKNKKKQGKKGNEKESPGMNRSVEHAYHGIRHAVSDR